MARKDKYYGTNTSLGGKKLEKIRLLGYNGSHNQFNVVCKAKSMAEANRKAKSLGLSDKTFESAFTSETGNTIQLEMADKYGFIICVNGTLGNDYVAIEELF